MNKRAKISLLLVYIVSILFIYCGLRFYPYYHIPILVFMLVGLIWIGQMIKKYLIRKPKTFIVLSFLFSVFLSYRCMNHSYLFLSKKQDLFQYRFVQTIKQEESPTFLNMGGQDCGIYTMANLIPTTYYFQHYNFDYDKFPDILNSFQKYIEEKQTLFVLYFTEEELDVEKEDSILFQNYELIDYEEKALEHRYHAYLLKRKS